MSLIFVPHPEQKFSIHPDKSALEGAVGSSTVHQGTQEESCLRVHGEIGRQTPVADVDSAAIHGPSPASLSHDLEASGKHCLRLSPPSERAFVEV